ncbi:MOSC domain-containing protein [Polymorphospora rubra]|uniref:Molybdenum cofactor biosysynthesis protein n=1 Tax=Polymorphospora rubra TaxID=338584 RepID=A0A810MT26_9ACTN|nr:MOSC N-terminal beta barrel domain-containing protein [Polymorphospora rubra]BCJ64191.1 molybdenum cofactor biosysynthesis protein [Polymorphospora rubra]
MRLASLHTHPVKGCHRLDHDTIHVEPWGLAGDRRWLVIDEDGVGVTQRDTAALVHIRPAPRPGGGLVLHATGRHPLDVPEPAGDPLDVQIFVNRTPVAAAPAGPAADHWLSTLIDRKVRLVWLANPADQPIGTELSRPEDRVSFADRYPMLVTNTASLDALNSLLREAGDIEGPLPMNRFRANLVVSGADPWAEDDWIGRRLRFGNVVMRAVKACARCLVTTIDQETGEKGRQPLRLLARHRNRDQKLLFGVNLIPDGTGPITVGDPVELMP